jgi:hypothetical protein
VTAAADLIQWYFPKNSLMSSTIWFGHSMQAKCPPCSCTPRSACEVEHKGIALTSEEFQIRRRGGRRSLRWTRIRIIGECRVPKRHSDQVLLFSIELGIHLMPNIFILTQHACHNARWREEVDGKRGTHIIQPLFVFQRRDSKRRISQFTVFLAHEHHNAHGVV